MLLSGSQPYYSCNGNNHAKETSVVASFPDGLEPELMPKHIAVIMDGNRRWAEEKGLPIEEGHSAGRRAMIDLARRCSAWGIQSLTVFMFSTENWRRSREQVDSLMNLFKEIVGIDLEQITRIGIKVSFIGDKTKLPNTLQDLMNTTEETSKSNTGLHLRVALNYGGRYDILQATKCIAEKVKEGSIDIQDIDESIFEQQLETPTADLLIRTGGDRRISNFMLWQIAYTELFFYDKWFPDFGEEDLLATLKSYKKRERRFGGTKNP